MTTQNFPDININVATSFPDGRYDGTRIENVCRIDFGESILIFKRENPNSPLIKFAGIFPAKYTMITPIS